MVVLAALLYFAEPAKPEFPEQVPGLMEACLASAVAAGEVSETDESHKYICAGDIAERLWTFLEHAKLESYEQDTPEGRWLGREFPLGGCFKRLRMPSGEPASDGLSCTIWVPRGVIGKPSATP